MFDCFLGRRIYEKLAPCWPEGLPLRPGGLELTEKALSVCSFPPGARVLDIGCGTASTVEYLVARHGFRALGLDPSLVMLESGLKRNATLPVVQAAGEDLPFRECVWDGIMAECSLSVARDAAFVLRECYRVLKDGGKLLVCDLYRRDARAGVPGDRALSVPRSSLCGRPEAVRGRVEGRAPDAMTPVEHERDASKYVREHEGVPSKQEIMERLHASGFEVALWEDHSPALTRFAAQLILSGDILEFQCGGLAPRGDDNRSFVHSLYPLCGDGLGYFLLIAGKPGRGSSNPAEPAKGTGG